MTKVPLIAGPTASGKTAVAMALAEMVGGVIINADAMQVYADLRVLTARPSTADEERVPHRLYGVSRGSDRWSAGRFARAASESIEEIIAMGRTPIVVGGTGLWLKALIEGLSPIPDVPDESCRAADEVLMQKGMNGLRDEVIAIDPQMEHLTPTDTQRHLRAWAVHHATGVPLSTWQSAPPSPVTSREFLPIVLQPDRKTLYDRCNQRFETMVAAGAIEEVRFLMEQNLDSSLPLSKAVGVPEITAYLEDQLSLDDAIAAAQQSTRRLAKRQMTWFRGQGKEWPVFEDAGDALEYFRGQIVEA